MRGKITKILQKQKPWTDNSPEKDRNSPKHRKICLTSLLSKIQIETTLKYHFTHQTGIKVKKLPNYDQAVGTHRCPHLLLVGRRRVLTSRQGNWAVTKLFAFTYPQTQQFPLEMFSNYICPTVQKYTVHKVINCSITCLQKYWLYLCNPDSPNVMYTLGKKKTISRNGRDCLGYIKWRKWSAKKHLY